MVVVFYLTTLMYRGRMMFFTTLVPLFSIPCAAKPPENTTQDDPLPKPGPFISSIPTLGVQPMEAVLVKSLMANYSKDVKPTVGVQDQIVINSGFALARVKNLDERNEVMTSFGWANMIWHDAQLMWDPANFEGAYQVILPANKIWLPEVSLLNGLEELGDLGIRSNFRVSVYADGTVVWVPGFKWVTTCNVNLRYFPFDTQVCSLQFVSWMYQAGLLNFTASSDKVMMDMYEGSGEWQLLDSRVWWEGRETASWPGVVFPIIQFSVTLRRSASYFILNVLIPSITMTAVHALVFLLPPESGEKVSLGITTLLSYSVVLLMVSDISPRSGSAIPVLTIYITASMTMTALSLLQTVLVLVLHHHSPDTPVPAWLRRFTSCLGCLVCMKPRKNLSIEAVHPMPCEKMALEDLDDNPKKQPLINIAGDCLFPPEVVQFVRLLMEKEKVKDTTNHNKEEWESVAKVLDRCFLICACGSAVFATLLFLVYIIYPVD